MSPRLPSLIPGVLLLLLATTGCEPLEPCTECPDVAGTYTIRAQPIDSIGSGTGLDAPCAAIAFPGVNDTLVITQSNGSTLEAEGWMRFKIREGTQGTLFEDDSLVFGPVHYAQSSGGEILITLTGLFLEARDGWVVQGQALFDLNLQACNLSTPLDLIQVP